MSDDHIFTGATGFVGSAIILELLQKRPEARIHALVRPGTEGAEARLKGTLHQAARLYGHDDSLDHAIATRCQAQAGDLFEALCGVDPPAHWRGAEFWHCAASLQYQDRHKEAIYRSNIQGTAHALALAQAIGARRFNHLSTAYVAGTRTGLQLEAPVSEGHNNNHYERSKVLAEGLALDADLHVRVLRPSVVIGHSQTMAALNFNGLYGFIRGLVKFRGALERAQTAISERLQIRMRADRDGTLNFIPVDYVAHDAVALSQRDAAPGIYHLSTDDPPNTGAALDTVFEVVGLQPPLMVGNDVELSWLDRKFNERIDFYVAYFQSTKLFSRAQTDAAVGNSYGGSFRLDRDLLIHFCRWYYDQLIEQRAALPVTQ